MCQCRLHDHLLNGGWLTQCFYDSEFATYYVVAGGRIELPERGHEPRVLTFTLARNIPTLYSYAKQVSFFSLFLNFFHFFANFF